MICANRGCGNEAPPRFTKCAACLLGTRKSQQIAAGIASVTALPPVLAPPGALAFRVAGSPLSWNNALIRLQRGRPFLSAKARAWKQTIAHAALIARPREWTILGRFALEVRSMFGSAAADTDGPLKLIQDALQHVAYANDRQVQSATCARLGVSRSAPYVEVICVRLDDVGTHDPSGNLDTHLRKDKRGTP